PSAAAVVAVTAPNRPLTVAWCGDCRAYILPRPGNTAQRLTNDHNLRRVSPEDDETLPGDRSMLTSLLGTCDDDESALTSFGHPVVEAVTLPGAPGESRRLVLASCGAYEPHEDGGHPLAGELTGTPREAARRFTAKAVQLSLAASRALDPNRPNADNAT
ncbi:mucin-2, partial [Streptomyces nanshensis]